MSADKKKLRFITYLSPGIPVEVFEIVAHYLEEVMDLETSLIYESRYLGPPGDKVDPFTADEVDIGFMGGQEFLRLVQKKNKFIELCGAGAVHDHAKNGSGKPDYYSDVIIKSTNATKYKELHDLRGNTFGYSSERSSAGCLLMLDHLKKSGLDTSFFREIVETGSHLASIESVLDSRVEVAAIDSNVLTGYLLRYPHKQEDLKTMISLGPLPTYPIVLNTRLSDELKGKITNELLKISTNPKWNAKLTHWKISGFVPIDMSTYNTEKTLQESKLNIKKTYY